MSDPRPARFPGSLDLSAAIAENAARVSRRRLFGSAGMGIGGVALAAMLGREGAAAGPAIAGLPDLPHHPPKAKRVVMLWQGGGPSHVDLYDPKPVMRERAGQDIPESVRGTTRLSTMSSGYAKWPIQPAIKPFKRYGNSGIELSEMLPNVGGIADEICVVRSMNTEAVNHAPGVTLFMTGGWTALVLGQLLPHFVMDALGSYLFYAQHNFPGVSFADKDGWTYEKAALESSIYMKMNPVLAWFTANIGYHHIHHLNHRIPFYRLPEVLAAIPELQAPKTTTLRPSDIVRCLKLKVWDVAQQRMVGVRGL